MNDLYCRWFEPAEIQSAVRTMWNQCRRAPAGQLDAVQQSRRQQQTKTAIIAGGALEKGSGLIDLQAVVRRQMHLTANVQYSREVSLTVRSLDTRTQ